MKDYIRLIVVFALLLVIIPCIGFFDKKTEVESADSGGETVAILSISSGEITQYSMKDYIVGAVFAQMPADFEEEALKAQAVLASTYAKRRILSEKQSPDESLCGAHMSDDSEKYQAFFTPEQAREVYGEGYAQAYEKISAAAEYAQNLTLEYDGEPIMTAFHGISYGSTESALSVWGEEVPYLQSADSEWDAQLEQCASEEEIDEQALAEKLAERYSVEISGGVLAEPIRICERTEGGTALKLTAGGVQIDAGEFCEIFGLASQHFSISLADGKYTFSVMGCGHLVGMSQYGANEMARNGSSCEEILVHYFEGTTVVRG